jgi:hypothetical protein
MQLTINSLASELGTNFYIVSFTIHEGSLLHCEMKMALRDSWFNTTLPHMTRVELKSNILKQLSHYLKSIVSYDVDLSTVASFSNDFDVIVGG